MTRMKRGFAAMSPAKLKRISEKAGRISAARGAGHRFTAGEEAREAGRKGGAAVKKVNDANS